MDKMFQVKDNECVGFDSKWRVKKVSTVNSSQTTEYELKEIETQTAVKAEMETQTDVSHLPDVEMEKVATWLKSIYPQVERELSDANSANNAFKDYKPIFDGVVAQAKLLQTINTFARPNNSGDEALRISAMSLNCTGQTLAISCNFMHKNWCHHPGSIKLYTFAKDDQLPDKPVKKLATDSCVTYLQYHPSLQFVLASGLYSGDVIIWNIEHSSGNGVLCKVNGHKEGITQISWVNDVKAPKALLLATSSLDGFLNTWNFSFANSSLKIKEKYKIKPPLLGRISQTVETTNIPNKVNRGVIGFDFSSYMPEIFVVGVEGGLVVQCSMLGSHYALAGSTSEVPVSDPVYKYYEPLEGEIQSIKFSPNRREMFLTLGTLGEIRIYVLGQDEPAQVIFLEKSLMIASWIPFEEKLICGCGERGVLEMFDVLKARPLKNIGKFEGLKQCLMTQMVLSSKRPTTVITGNELGVIHLWSVPWRQFSMKL